MHIIINTMSSVPRKQTHLFFCNHSTTIHGICTSKVVFFLFSCLFFILIIFPCPPPPHVKYCPLLQRATSTATTLDMHTVSCSSQDSTSKCLLYLPSPSVCRLPSTVCRLPSAVYYHSSFGWPIAIQYEIDPSRSMPSTLLIHSYALWPLPANFDPGLRGLCTCLYP